MQDKLPTFLRANARDQCIPQADRGRKVRQANRLGSLPSDLSAFNTISDVTACVKGSQPTWEVYKIQLRAKTKNAQRAIPPTAQPKKLSEHTLLRDKENPSFHTRYEGPTDITVATNHDIRKAHITSQAECKKNSI